MPSFYLSNKNNMDELRESKDELIADLRQQVLAIKDENENKLNTLEKNYQNDVIEYRNKLHEIELMAQKSREDNFEKEPETIPEKPLFLDKMIEAAKRLGNELDFVRIDFFANQAQFFLSEMTIYPNGEQDNRPTSYDQFNLFLGKQWNMDFWQ